MPTLQPRLGEALSGLTPAELARFVDGQMDFRRVLKPEEGLGPIHNLFSCGACHSNPTGGSGTVTVTMFGRVDDSGFDPLVELGGPLWQSESTSGDCAERVPPEANVLADRITTSVLGGGLVEAIADSAILALAQHPPPGISGRVHWVRALEDEPGAARRVGRFGWKSQVATLLTFSASAARNELGLTNRLLPHENYPNGDTAKAQRCDTVPDPEDHPNSDGYDYLDRVTVFQRYLAPPPQTPRSGMEGEAVFTRIGCASCHVPAFITAADQALEPVLRLQTIKPYSDFLLHDMGALGDGIAQGQAERREMRTTPLWGVRIRFPILHDGRVSGATLAERITRAVEAHAGEAAASVGEFRALTKQQHGRLLAFLDSLGRVEFDNDGDNDVDLADLRFLAQCTSGVRPSTYTPDDRCSISDIDRDGDIDLVDHALFQRAYTGSAYGSTIAVP